MLTMVEPVSFFTRYNFLSIEPTFNETKNIDVLNIKE